MLTKRQKIVRGIPGMLVGIAMIGILVWGISGDRKCKKLLNEENCIIELVFCKYSTRSLRGSGYEISTGFVSTKDTSVYFITDAFLKPLPNGLPVVVKYSQKDNTCYRFLWDSATVFNEQKVLFFRVKNQGIDYQITAID